jgi:hypothetical protein
LQRLIAEGNAKANEKVFRVLRELQVQLESDAGNSASRKNGLFFGDSEADTQDFPPPHLGGHIGQGASPGSRGFTEGKSTPSRSDDSGGSDYLSFVDKDEQKKLKLIKSFYEEIGQSRNAKLSGRKSLFWEYPINSKDSLGRVLKIELKYGELTRKEIKIVSNKAEDLRQTQGGVFESEKTDKKICMEITKKVITEIEKESSAESGSVCISSSPSRAAMKKKKNRRYRTAQFKNSESHIGVAVRRTGGAVLH